MNFTIYENGAGNLGLNFKEENAIYSCIDQKFQVLSAQQFKNILPIDGTDSDLRMEDVTNKFTFEEDEKTILAKIDYLKKSDDILYWNNSYDFVKAMITSQRSAILNEGISQETLDYLHSATLNQNTRDNNLVDKFTFIDPDFCKEDFLKEEFDLKKIFGRIPKAGTHIVFYTLQSPSHTSNNEVIENNNIDNICQDFSEYHALLIDDDHVIGELVNSPYGTLNYNNTVPLKNYLSSIAVTHNDTFRKAYIVENSYCSKIDSLQKRLVEQQYKRVIRYSNTPMANFVRYCQSGIPVDNPFEYEFSTRTRRYKKIMIVNMAARLSHALYLVKSHPAAERVSINSIATAINKPKQTVYNWFKAVNSKKSIDPSNLMKIVEQLKVINPFWIIYGSKCPAIIPTDPNNSNEIKQFEDELKNIPFFSIPAPSQEQSEIHNLCKELLLKLLKNFGIELYSKPDVIELKSHVFVNRSDNPIKESENKHLKSIFLDANKYSKTDFLYIENTDNSLFPTITDKDYLLIRKDRSPIPKDVNMSGFRERGKNLGYYLVTINDVATCCSVYLDVMLKFVKINITAKETNPSFLQSPWKPIMDDQYDLIQEGRHMGQTKVRFIGEIVKIERYFSKNK
jgi:hypothetical protein